MERDSESSSRGRPARTLSVKPDAWSTLGMDLELPEVNLVLSDAVGKILHQTQVETRHDLGDPRHVLDRLSDMIHQWIYDTGHSIQRIAGLGMGIPGFLTPKGVSFVGRQLPKWEQVPVKEHLEERLGLPVLIQHDVHLMALAEVERRGWTDGLALFITVRPGLDDDLRIGAAICMDGRIFVGGHGNGGALYRAVVNFRSSAKTAESSRVERIAKRLVESLIHAVPLIDPERIIIHAECLGHQEAELIACCRLALDEAMRGEYVGMAEICGAEVRGASGAHQAAISVTRQLLLQPAPITGVTGGR